MSRSIDNIHHLPAPASIHDLVESGDLERDTDHDIYPSPGNPLGVADCLIQDLFIEDGALTLRYWRGDFWQYRHGSWRQLQDELDIKEPLWERLSEVGYTNDNDVKAWSPTPAKVSNLLEPLAIRTRLPGGTNPPTWLDGAHDPGEKTIVMRNGIFGLDTSTLYDHTPHHFSTWSLPFDYDPKATCPRWHQFLKEVFGHDPAAAKLLQEYFGYLISGAVNHQKALLVVGPSGAGKGVMSYVANQLMGAGNTATTTFHDLASEFGLKGLIGKPLTVIEDARADDMRRRNSAPVEKLLHIIANDPVTINRKNQDYWEGRLNTRMMIFTNEIPRLKDSSGAILRRFNMIRLTRKFAGGKTEDVNLKDTLHRELSGIFNWALDGLKRLTSTNTFTEAASAQEISDTMADMASPITVFIDEQRFTVTEDPEDFVPLSRMHAAYRAWCEERNQAAGNQDTFCQALQAAYAGVFKKNTKPSEDVAKTRYIFGVKEDPTKQIFN